ncbi:ABC transporter permease [Candidatus Pacearchaeota archaeon]|nr:ABC transporter permease [Candidatus Pacearchaeota archaeon]
MDYFVFSVRNLKRKGIRSWLTLLGILIGIAAVVSLITVGSGLKVAVNSQFGASSTEVITIQAGGTSFGPPGSGTVIPLTKQDAIAIEQLSSVELAIPRNIEVGKMEYNNIVQFGYAGSVVDGREKEIYELVGNIEAEYGRLLESGDFGKVMLGYSFYEGEKNGYEKDILPGKKVLIKDKSFEVVGIVKKQGSFILDSIVWIQDSDLENLIGYGDNVSLIVVKAKNKDSIDRAKEDIEKLLRNRRDVKIGEENFEVSTPEATLESVNSVLNGIQIFIIIIASISIFIGIIGIVNTMTTSVLERKKEIGIMKAIGAKNSQIFMQFFVESGMLGLIGGAIGIILGLLLGYVGIGAINSFLGSETQPQINFILILFSLIGSFLIGSIAGIFPAMQAAKQNPVEALRG